MGNRIVCFWIEPTDRVRLSLRRYVSSDDPSRKCQGKYGYHNGHSPFGEHPARLCVAPNGSRCLDSWADAAPPRTDPRWPAKCDLCDYVFVADDAWQVFQDQVYVRKDTGEEMLLRDAPAGAMWDCTWFPADWKKADGRHLCVMTPGGEWEIDGEAKGGGGWTRTGEPPRITARPSILIEGRYHGFLTDGVLEEC